MTQSSPHNAEFTLGNDDFIGFQELSLKHTGIKLSASKGDMITSRFSRRLRMLGISNFKDYLDLVRQEEHPERSIFVDTITTNLTYFFREPHHFKALEEHILPKLRSNQPASKPIRIWSAGCSSGQEPYSIAITIAESDPTITRPTRILSTDIHSKMVQQTRLGQYGKHELRGLSPEQIQRWFVLKPDGKHYAKKLLKDMLVSKQLNLFDPWPFRPHVDIIFCRNTLIYFSPSMQKGLVNKFAQIQKPGSTLILGHSESLQSGSKLYRRIANTVYERI